MTAQAYMQGKANKAILSGLEKTLAATFVLYFKTHAFHWNVTGPDFSQLHALFEEQYTELWAATDEIAERMRAIGGFAPGTLASLIKASALDESGQLPDAGAMIEQLAADNRDIVNTLYEAMKPAEDKGDEGTVDMLVGRIKIHEKAAWMLESHLKG